jgi:hypothetical protein
MVSYKDVVEDFKKNPKINILQTFRGVEAVKKYKSFHPEADVAQFSAEERKNSFFLVLRRKLRVHYEFLVKYYIGSGDDLVVWGERYKEGQWDTVRKDHGL